MLARSACGRSSVLALALCAASPAYAAIDLVGATDATFVWQPAPGPVAGYVVYQVCEADAGTRETNVDTNQVTLSPQACTSFSVQVAAFAAGGATQPGPISEPSELVRFLPVAPPPAPPPTGDPVADGGDAVLPPRPAFDLDGDGRSEVLIHHAGSGELQLWALLNARLLPWAILPAFPPAARIVGGGDYDGDGFPDLLGLDRGQVFVWLLRDATTTGGGLLGDDLGDAGSVEGSGDYDGDGVSDVLIRRPAQGRIDVWSMRGGAVAAVDTLAVDPGSNWRIIGSGDHDGDGISDILWHDAAEGQLVLWRLLGRGNFETRVLPAPLAGLWEGVGVADFDGDGTADVLWRQRDTGEVAISRFDANGILETRRLEDVGAVASREIVGTGDLDGDGNPDILVRFVGTTGLRLWSMSGIAVASRTRIARLAAGWNAVSLGDESPSGHRWNP